MVEPETKKLFQHLLAFWPHFSLHRRSCSITGKSLISVFDSECPYPVCDREYWLENANPPAAKFDGARPFFDQLYSLFVQCPIPHNEVIGSENCVYTDDWWFSRDCYLCHSGIENEDCQYCYRVLRCKDSRFAVFCMRCELCIDVVNSSDCFSLCYAVSCRFCRDSAFLFDCRNCHDCLFCWNLRNKQYCIENQQYTKEEYLRRLAGHDLSRRFVYLKAVAHFQEIVRTKAYWKAREVEKCENCTGDYLDQCKNCQNCYFLQKAEDCKNYVRGYDIKHVTDSVGSFSSQLLHKTCCVQDRCYDVRFSFFISQSRFLEYCAYCRSCEHCFACCGLVGKRYHIFNREYSAQEYPVEVEKIRARMREEGVGNEFFPARFAPGAYDGSLAGYYFDLKETEGRKLGYRFLAADQRPDAKGLSITDIPDSSVSVPSSVVGAVFWDDEARKSVRITQDDIDFARQVLSPLPYCYYLSRIKLLFSMLPFDGQMRTTTCAKTKQPVQTNLPSSLDGRIVAEEAHEQLVLS